MVRLPRQGADALQNADAERRGTQVLRSVRDLTSIKWQVLAPGTRHLRHTRVRSLFVRPGGARIESMKKYAAAIGVQGSRSGVYQDR